MTTHMMTSREFNHDLSAAKRAAQSGPVIVTDRGRPAHVLLSIETYERLTRPQHSIVDMLSMPSVAEIEFEPPRATRITRLPVID